MRNVLIACDNNILGIVTYNIIYYPTAAAEDYVLLYYTNILLLCFLVYADADGRFDVQQQHYC